MTFDDEILIAAPIDEVWAVYSDVEHWPEWTASVRECHYVAGTTLQPGARVRIAQPKLPVATWEVQALEPGRAWTWVATGPGVRTTAIHTLVAEGPDATRVRMQLEQRGPVGAIVARVYARLTRSYLAMEAAGLKRRCETAAAA